MLDNGNSPLDCFGNYGIRKCDCDKANECLEKLKQRIIGLVKINHRRRYTNIEIDLYKVPFNFTENAQKKLSLLFSVYAAKGYNGGISRTVCYLRVPTDCADEFMCKFTEIITDPKNLEPLP
jgi:hypothetical protein